MARQISDVLKDEQTTYTNESVQNASDMVNKLCERYGPEFAGKLIASITEDTDLQIREDGNDAANQQNQQQQNGGDAQQQNNTGDQQNQQQQVVSQQQDIKQVQAGQNQPTAEMVTKFDEIVKSISEYAPLCNGTVAAGEMNAIIQVVNKFKNDIVKVVNNAAQQQNNT